MHYVYRVQDVNCQGARRRDSRNSGLGICVRNGASLQVKNSSSRVLQDSDERVYRLGHIPPRTRDAEKYKTADDDINYRALCRGRDLINASERAHLKCHLSDLTHPFFRVVKQDILHWKRNYTYSKFSLRDLPLCF